MPDSNARPVALVTGASAGIGYEFALRLAERGFDLILVARRRERLDELAALARSRHGCERAEVFVADLANPSAPAAIGAEVDRLGLAVDLLVNNAGFGTHGLFEAQSLERERDEITVNVSALVALTHLFLPAMLRAGSGGIINVASTAAFAPVPYMAVYGATKAFVRSFSEALHEEVHRRGVRVSCLCPGPTATEFSGESGAPHRGPVRTSAEVVATALHAYDGGKAVVIDGLSNKILMSLSGFVPRAWSTRIAARLMRP